MWLVWLGAALAHPGAFRVAAHDLTAVLDDDQLTLHYTLEAPRLVELHDAPVHDIVPSIDEMLSGFVVQSDGRPLPLEPVGEPTVRDSHSTAAVSISLAVAVPHTTQTLTVENANYPQLDGLFRTQWALGPDWQFTGGSQYERADNGLWQRVERSEWTGTDRGRSSTLQVAPRPVWHRYATPIPDEPRRVLQTTTGPVWWAWTHGRPHPALSILALLLAPAVARIGPQPDEWSKGPVVLVAAAVATCLAWLGQPIWVSAACIGGLLGMALTRQWWMGGVVAAIGLAAAASLWPWALVAGACAGLATRTGEPSRATGVAVGIGIGVTLLWGIRSVA